MRDTEKSAKLARDERLQPHDEAALDWAGSNESPTAAVLHVAVTSSAVPAAGPGSACCGRSRGRCPRRARR